MVVRRSDDEPTKQQGAPMDTNHHTTIAPWPPATITPEGEVAIAAACAGIVVALRDAGIDVAILRDALAFLFDVELDAYGDPL